MNYLLALNLCLAIINITFSILLMRAWFKANRFLDKSKQLYEEMKECNHKMRGLPYVKIDERINNE